MSLELTLLIWSVPLLFLHIGVQSGLMTRDAGKDYNAGPRDSEPALSPIAGRAKRALANYLETLPAFIILALAAHVTGTSNWMTQFGAIAYLAARVAYIPPYLGGVKYIRSLAYMIACAGLLMMFIALI
jgi:uncharacterized MAPEG superfamily protein